jgi:hypothetical protein
VDAWPWLGTPERNDSAYLGKGQPEAPGPRDEVKHSQDIGRIDPVARRRTARCRHDASRLVQAERLPTHAAVSRHLADQ